MDAGYAEYNVMVLEHNSVFGPYRQVKVTRDDGRDGISWDTLQAIKNDVLGTDVLAVEIYPPEHDLVNTVNMRHLWEVPARLALPMGYRRHNGILWCQEGE